MAGVTGFQDFWLVGARLYVERLDANGVPGPLIDLGVLQQATPAFTTEKAELFDSDGGRRVLVAEEVQEINEVYEVRCSNLNMRNLALMFLSEDPTDSQINPIAYTQSHTSTLGELMKIKFAGTPRYGLGQIGGLYAAGGVIENHKITTFSLTAPHIVLKSTDGDKTSMYSADRRFIVTGWQTGQTTYIPTAQANLVGTYEVFSSAFSTTTNITLKSHTIPKQAYTAPDTAEVLTITPTVLDLPKIYNGPYAGSTDWETVSLKQGIIRIPTGSTIPNGAVFVNAYETGYTGLRRLKPQSLKTSVKVNMYLYYSRSNKSEETVREAVALITPNALALSADEFSSMTLNVKVVSDLTKADPAGRLEFYAGSAPALSGGAGFDEP